MGFASVDLTNSIFSFPTADSQPQIKIPFSVHGWLTLWMWRASCSFLGEKLYLDLWVCKRRQRYPHIVQGIAGSYGNPNIIFWETKLLSIVVAPFYNPTSSAVCFCFKKVWVFIFTSEKRSLSSLRPTPSNLTNMWSSFRCRFPLTGIPRPLHPLTTSPYGKLCKLWSAARTSLSQSKFCKGRSGLPPSLLGPWLG